MPKTHTGAFHGCLKIHENCKSLVTQIKPYTIPYNLSTTDIWGPKKYFVIQRFPLFRGCVVWLIVNLGPHKQSAVGRFLLLVEFAMGVTLILAKPL
jgi:hypothetical protein